MRLVVGRELPLAQLFHDVSPPLLNRSRLALALKSLHPHQPSMAGDCAKGTRL